MKDKMCILLSGMDSLSGTTSIQLVDRFKLKVYGGVKLGQMNELFYADFDTRIDTENNAENLHSFISLLSWFGLKKVKFRIDRSHLKDSQIDFQIHMIQDTDYIHLPKIVYIGDK